MFAIFNNVRSYEVHDIRVTKYAPTALGRSLGYKERFVVAQFNGHYGAWTINGEQTGSTEIPLTVGNEVVANNMLITHRFSLTADGNVVDSVSLYDFGVYDAPMLLEFNPVEELDETVTA
jgi:hypothetical protein